MSPTRRRWANTEDRRYDLEALAERVGARNHAELAQRLGLSVRWVKLMARHGLTERSADHFAVRAGMHPATVWPSWWQDTSGDGDDGWFADDPEEELAVAG